jgi:mucin-19
MKKTSCVIITAAFLTASGFTGKQKPAEIWNVTTVAGWEDKNLSIDGPGVKACFTWQVYNSAFDSEGNLYVIDQTNLRKVDKDMNVTTLFGMGVTDAAGNSADIKPLSGQDGICTDKDNNIYVSNRGTHMIYRIKPDRSAEPFAGDDGYKGKEDGDRLQAGFNGPTALCIDKNGSIYVADTYNSSVRKISKEGKVTTLAGNGQIGDFKTGTGKAAQFLEFRSIAVDSKGNVYIAQNGRGSCVARISPAGTVTNFVGDVDALTPSGANHNGTGKAARFMRIQALAVDKDDNLIIGEKSRVRKATPAGIVTTLAGNETDTWRDAAGIKAGFASIGGLSIDAAGNIFVSDQYCIRKMTKQ